MIISVLGVPGCLLAGWAVELPIFGRRGTLAIFSGKRTYLLFHVVTLFNDLPRESRALVFSVDRRLPVREHDGKEQWGIAVVELWVCVLQQRKCRRTRRVIDDVDDGDGIVKIMYGVLYAISPEIFPAKDRGTGNGLTATAARLFAILVRKSLPHLFQSPKSLLVSPTPRWPI